VLLVQQVSLLVELALPLVHPLMLLHHLCALRKQLRSGFWIAWRLSDGFPHLLYGGVFRSLELFGMGY